jgi:hypothetical protein
MKRMMFALFLVASTAGATELKQSLADDPKYDGACADVVATIIYSKDHKGDSDPKIDEYVSLCKRNPDRDICDEAQKMIAREGINYRFVCTGGG